MGREPNRNAASSASKWGNSVGVQLPKTFTSERAIVEGGTIGIDNLSVFNPPRRVRSCYKLKDLLSGYARPPRTVDFRRAGKELA